MKEVVALFGIVCCVAGLMVPLPAAEGVTLQVGRFAEQPSVEPPFAPVQVQLHGLPVPVTALAVPAVQRLVAGAVVKVPLFAEPQTPFWLNVATTEQFAVIAFVV